MPNLKDKFDEFIKNNDVNGALDYAYQLYSDMRKSYAEGGNPFSEENTERSRAVEAFIAEITACDGKKEILPEKREFLDRFLLAMTKRNLDTSVKLGYERDAWETRIRDGEVKDTELIKDEPDAVKKVAHDIVLEKNQDANIIPDLFLKVAEGLLSKTIDGKNAHQVYENLAETCYLDAINEKNIPEEKLSDYMKAFIDRNPSTSTGYKVKVGEYKEGEPLFDSVPDYVTELKQVHTMDDIAAFEEEAYRNINNFARHDTQVKSSVKTALSLLAKLDAEATDADRTAEFVALRKALEEYTHLGKDYNFIIPDAPLSVYNPITPDTAYPIVEDAVKKLFDAAEAYDEVMSEAKENTAGTDEASIKHVKKLAGLATDLYNFGFVQNQSNEEFGKLKISVSNVKSAQKKLKYLDKFKAQNGLPGYERDYEGNGVKRLYEEKIKKQIDALTDNLNNDGVTHKLYDDLIKALMDEVRINHKKATLTGANEEQKNAVQKEQDRNQAKIKGLIAECRDFEKTNQIKLNLTGNNPDRLKLLDGIEKSLTNKMDVSYDSYMELHTAENGGKTPKEMVENLSKVMAAHTLKSKGYDFDLGLIHKTAKQVRELYCLDKLENQPEILKKALREETMAVKCVGEMSRTVFGIKEENLKEYSDEMKKLLDNMWSPEGRSEEYNALYNAVKAASEINGKDMTPQEKGRAVRTANIEIVDAVEAYTKGKENVRWSDDGKARFDNSLDALAVASKYAPGMKVHVNKTLQRINKVRDVKPGDPTYFDPEKFGENYGAERAKVANEKAMAAKAAEKAPAKAAPSV